MGVQLYVETTTEIKNETQLLFQEHKAKELINLLYEEIK
jgi:hypothetical protein